jgi:hypothetical protein
MKLDVLTCVLKETSKHCHVRIVQELEFVKINFILRFMLEDITSLLFMSHFHVILLNQDLNQNLRYCCKRRLRQDLAMLGYTPCLNFMHKPCYIIVISCCMFFSKISPRIVVQRNENSSLN